jgi:hypothetical protein
MNTAVKRAPMEERSVRIVTGTYAVQPEDHVVWGDATLGDVTIRLPAPELAFDRQTGVGRTFIVGKCAGEHAVSIPQADVPAGARITEIDRGLVVICDGAAWWVMTRA